MRGSTGAKGAGPSLRAVSFNAYLTTLVLTTTSGWQTCAVPPDGVPQASGSSVFQTWAAGDGWVNFQDVRTAKRPPTETAKAPTDAPDHYLTGPIEVVWTGSGVLDLSWPASTAPYENEVIGGADPNVAKVSAIMPDGKVAWPGRERHVHHRPGHTWAVGLPPE